MTDAKTNAQDDARRDFAKFQHEYVLKNIAAADTKAIALIAVASALLGYACQNHEYLHWIKIWPNAWCLRDWLAGVAVLALVVSEASALRVLWPNLSGAAQGTIYWRSVANFKSADEYAQTILRTNDNVLTENLLRHCFEVSRVCRSKYRRLRVGLWAGLFGVAALFIDFAIVTSGGN